MELEGLLNILTLSKTAENQYDGFSKTVGSKNVFGGQLLAQAVGAAHKTVDQERILNSLHCYFLEPGNLEIPISYKVKCIRDGNSFSTREIMASQKGKTIFIMNASFHKRQTGYEHQLPIKEGIKQPEELMSWNDILQKFGKNLPKSVKVFMSAERPFYFKTVDFYSLLEKKDLPPFVDVWFKIKGDTRNLSLELKQQILTYISDYNILTTCLSPNASRANLENTRISSLDHSMWFFRDFDLDDWMLFSIKSPNSFGCRGLAQGNIFTRQGKLIASVAQEGLIRPKK